MVSASRQVHSDPEEARMAGEVPPGGSILGRGVAQGGVFSSPDLAGIVDMTGLAYNSAGIHKGAMAATR